MIDVFYFDKKIKKGDFKSIGKLKGKRIWIDITDIKKEESEVISKYFNLHPLSKEDLINLPMRIKVEEFPDYLFCVFYGILDDKQLSLSGLDFVIGKNFLITNHKKRINSFEELKKNPDILENVMKKGVDFLFHKLLDKEIDNFSPVLERIDDEIEHIEENVARKARPHLLKKILAIKRHIVLIKKVTMPQREKISFLAKNEYKLLSKNTIPYFRDVYDHAIRVSDQIENYREAIGNTFDIYMSSVSNNMNEVMKVLSIIATIALPLTVISGIYGTNFSNLPGQGFYYGFWIMILLMILMSVGMILFFKKKGWF